MAYAYILNIIIIMHKFKYDQIIVIGCSFSCGTEMNDHLLSIYRNEKERQFQIWKWAKENIDIKFTSVQHLQTEAMKHWEKKERAVSWPEMLQTKTDIPVTNLSKIGSSIGNSLISYSNFLRNHDIKKRTLAIHQLPAFGRMHLRFNNDVKINVLPVDIQTKSNFGFDKSYFKDNIENVHRLYKQKILKIDFFEKYVNKILARIEKLSLDNNIKNYYIMPGDNMNVTLLDQKVIIEDFTSFRSNYPTGVLGHPIGNDFNRDLCDIIVSTCF